QLKAADAAETSQKLFDAADTPAKTRSDAFQVLLLTADKSEATKRAAAALDDAMPAVRKAAVLYLTSGTEAFDHLVDGAFPLAFNPPFAPSSAFDSEKAVSLDPPRGVTAEQVAKLLKETDPEVVARAQYLLVLLGDERQLDPFVKYWR